MVALRNSVPTYGLVAEHAMMCPRVMVWLAMVAVIGAHPGRVSHQIRSIMRALVAAARRAARQPSSSSRTKSSAARGENRVGRRAGSRSAVALVGGRGVAAAFRECSVAEATEDVARVVAEYLEQHAKSNGTSVVQLDSMTTVSQLQCIGAGGVGIAYSGGIRWQARRRQVPVPAANIASGLQVGPADT